MGGHSSAWEDLGLEGSQGTGRSYPVSAWSRGAEGSSAATADPGGRRVGRPETTELPFCLDVLPASSSQSQPQPPVRGRGGRRPARGVHEPLSRSGGPEIRDTIRT